MLSIHIGLGEKLSMKLAELAWIYYHRISCCRYTQHSTAHGHFGNGPISFSVPFVTDLPTADSIFFFSFTDVCFRLFSILKFPVLSFKLPAIRDLVIHAIRSSDLLF